MNPILFNVMLLLVLPSDQIVKLEKQALKYDMSIELLLELYVLERLETSNTYVEVQKVEKEEYIIED